MDYTKTSTYHSPNKKQPLIIIIGLGSIGSNTALTLAKTGFVNLQLWDHDTIEQTNLPAQIYKENQTGKHKTEAIQENIKEYADTIAEIKTRKYETKDVQIYPTGTIIILALDNIQEKETLYKRLSMNTSQYIIDARNGSGNYQIYTHNTNTDWREIQEHKDNKFKGPFTEQPCGDKTNYPTNLLIAAKITENIRKITNKETYHKTIIGHINNNTPEIRA